MLNQSQIDAIPQELRALHQWVGAGQDKVPLSPTGNAASVTDPSTWGSFEDVLKGMAGGQYPHIGFVFTDNDPYLFIDLDAPKDEHKHILPPTHPDYIKMQASGASWIKAMGSYSEISASGHGIHIYVRAKLKNALKMPGTELYFTQRYAIVTGDAILNVPIADRQQEIDQLIVGLKSSSPRAPQASYKVTPSQPDQDAPILSSLAKASNAASIQQLWEGNWTHTHPSQSEADMALLSHLCFYSQDDEQVARLFRQSALGQRKKANNPRDPYVEQSIAKIRALAPAPVDFTKFKPQPTPHLQPLPRPATHYPPPPGTMGQIAKYIFGAAVRPVNEVAYAGAIAFCAGIAGRHYNISGTGLNLYVMLLAPTGAGKEGAADGIDKLYSAIRTTVPEVEQFRGPANFASGQALVRNLGERTLPCCLSVIGEFGIRLSQMVHPRANSAELALKQVLLDLFSKSGENHTLSPTVYSDSAKNTNLMYAPALSILGVSTPVTFFDALSQGAAGDGLIPRFLTIHSNADPQLSNLDRATDVDPTLVAKLADVVQHSLYMARNNSFCHIRVGDGPSRMLRHMEGIIVDRMTALNPEDPARDILNRSHLKVLRLAALAAVFDNPKDPEVTEEHAEWAIKFIEADASYMRIKFDTGHVGTGDHKALAMLRDKIKQLLSAQVSIKDPIYVDMLTQGAIPYSLLAQKLLQSPTFAGAPLGATRALKDALMTLEDMGELQSIPPQVCLTKFGRAAKAYGVLDLMGKKG